jgi:hypothetical protein
MNVRRGAIALGCAIALAPALVAQAEPAPLAGDNLRAALTGDAAREVAWAAHAARLANDRALAPPLLDALTRWRTDETLAGRTVCLHLLDALLGIAAPLPADVAAPLLDDDVCGVAAFALLARSPQHAEGVLLATFRRDVAALGPRDPLPPRTYLLGNVLAAQRTPGFAALVVARAPLDLQVAVRDRGPRRGSFGTTHHMARRALPGWPAPPAYRLASASQPIPAGWEPIVMPEPTRGSVQRSGPSRRGTGMVMSEPVPPSPPRGVEIEWLCTLAGVPAPLPTLEHGFDGLERFAARVTAARDERRELLRRVQNALVANGLLTAEQAQPLGGPVGVDVVDERGDTSVELPAIPAAR